MDIKVLQPQDLEAMMALAKQRLKHDSVDDMTFQLKSWQACWRQESLEHYLPMGWSFGLFEQEQLMGFFIAQPFVFFRSMAQTLWVEWIEAQAPEELHQLVDVAFRMAREKHFQKLVFNDMAHIKPTLMSFKSQPIDDHFIEIKTAKF